MNSNNLIKVLLIIFLYFGVLNIIKAQICETGRPFFYTERIKSETDVKTHIYNYPKSKLKNVSKKEETGSLNFAHQFTVNYTPENSGEIVILKNGTKVWYLVISSPNAYSINLIFDRFKLPKGAKLYIYNEELTDIIGAFTYKNNKPSGVLATAPVGGDKIIVEYQEPADVEFDGELLIGAVNHDFLGVFRNNSLKTGYFGDSGGCNEDMSCYDFDNNIDVSRSVVKMIINGTELCTGTMINNSNNDGTPYLITAAHCFREDKTANNTIVYFNYDSPHCSEIIEGSKSNTISGASTKVLVDSLDIALVELSKMPPANYQPYYAGWSLSSAPTGPYICIHHPQGDVKKIATSVTDVEQYTFKESSNFPYAQVNNFHWRVPVWNSGTTEGGSSGSALFDSNYRLIGTLSGGEASCGHQVNDYFSQFYKAWDHNSESTGQFAYWLDPENTGVQNLEGLDPYETNRDFRISNVQQGEIPAVERYQGAGYLSGHNDLGITTYAERFSGIQSARIKGVYIMPGQSVYSSTQSINLLVWNGNQTPTNLIAHKDGITLNELRKNKEVYVEFDTEIDVTGTFFVGYDIDYSGSPIDSFAVYHSSNENSKTLNTMMVKNNNNWELASQLYGTGNKSLWIDIIADMVIWADTQVVPDFTSNILIYPNPVVENTLLYFDSDKDYIQNYEIVGINGSVIEKHVVNRLSHKYPININNLSPGLYLIKFLLADNHIVCRKFIITTQ